LAVFGEVPFMAHLVHVKPKPAHICGATIISSCFVLTAAHCVEQNNIRQPRAYDYLQIKIGTRFLKTNQLKNAQDYESIQDFKIKKIVIHKEYTNNNGLNINDIALIQLMPGENGQCIQSLGEQEQIQAACLTSMEYLDPEDQNKVYNCSVSGWGTTERKKTVNQLRIVEMTMVSFEECEKKYEKGQNFLRDIKRRKHLCAKGDRTVNDKEKDACGGDSGGPFSCLIDTEYGTRSYLNGIVSFGVPCKDIHKKIPGVYTRVSQYYEWIEKNAVKLEDQESPFNADIVYEKK